MTDNTVQRPLLPPRRALLQRWARWLAWVTVVYNAAEAVIGIGAGAAAGSIALISFGGDSVVECLSALVIIWQFKGIPEQRERLAMRLIGVSFLVLAGYITLDSVHALVSGSDAEPSAVGIALAATSLVVMPVLSWAKRRTGSQLGSRAVVADSVQTLLCTYLSAVLLAGLVANAALGWFWADPIAALVIAAVAAREGWYTWREEPDDCC
jgi:divalent metal cation (Fe/Co/Zn/Cd) transporter